MGERDWQIMWRKKSWNPAKGRINDSWEILSCSGVSGIRKDLVRRELYGSVAWNSNSELWVSLSTKFKTQSWEFGWHSFSNSDLQSLPVQLLSGRTNIWSTRLSFSVFAISIFLNFSFSLPVYCFIYVSLDFNIGASRSPIVFCFFFNSYLGKIGC